jgi:hypothetical protein
VYKNYRFSLLSTSTQSTTYENENLTEANCVAVTDESCKLENKFHPKTTNIKQQKRKRESYVKGKSLSSNADMTHGNKLSPDISQKFSVTEALKEKEIKPIRSNICNNYNNLHILSDSHGRNLRQLLASKKVKFNITSFIKPNGTIQDVLNDDEVNNLKENDYLLIIGGTNNFNPHIKSSNDEIINVVKKKLNNLKKTKIILCGIPFRYDIPHLNHKISQTNFSLKKLSKQYTNVSYIGYKNFDRSCYTTHGLHLNFKGKCKLTNLIKSVITSNKNDNGFENKIPTIITNRQDTMNLKIKHQNNMFYKSYYVRNNFLTTVRNIITGI